MTTARVQMQAALAYAAAGLLVFPTDSAKHPLVRWKDAATTDPGIVSGWWAQHPLAGIGWALPDGLVVVDIDPGGAEVVRAAGGLPKTGPIARTPRGGWHIILALPDDGPWRQRQLGDHVDARVGGLGYIILPPSTGRSWWKPLLWPLDALVDPIRLPAASPWVVDRLRVLPELAQTRSQPARPGSTPSGLLRAVAEAQPGCRNNYQFWAATKLRDEGYPLADALAVLVPVAMATRQADEPPNDYRDQIAATIQSAYR